MNKGIGIPKKDGSGQGRRANKGRGGCVETKPKRERKRWFKRKK